jgi:hypothetical protein
MSRAHYSTLLYSFPTLGNLVIEGKFPKKLLHITNLRNSRTVTAGVTA